MKEKDRTPKDRTPPPRDRTKPVQVQKKKMHGGKLLVLLALVAAASLAVIVMTGGSPKADTFPVAPGGPPVTAEGFTMGRADAPVEVLEWADFECPGCMQFATLTEPDVRQRLVETGQVRFTFYFFPLTDIHRSAASAAYAAACAGDQQKFWEMHDAIFHGFSDWAAGRARNPKGVFQGYAERIGLDVPAWEQCYDGDEKRALIQSHVAAGVQREVGSTPTFFIGGRKVTGAIGYDQFKAYVDSALADARAGAPAPGDSARATPVPVGTGN